MVDWYEIPTADLFSGQMKGGQEFAGNSMQQPWIPFHKKKDRHEAMQPPFRSWKRYTSEELPFRIIQGSVH